jgi:hypothetical protein
MSKKNVFVAVVLAVCVIAAAGTLLASNMGFKLNYSLLSAAPGVSQTGKNTLALPYFRQTGLNDSNQLILDIGGGVVTPVTNVQRFNKVNDTFSVYTGRMGTPAPLFPLVSGDGYFVAMNANVNYIVVGAHDPALAYTLNAAQAGVSATGKNFYAPPYNITAANSIQLILDIGGGVVTPVINVQRFNRVNDTFAVYTGRMGTPAPVFPLTPGEAYFVAMNSTVPYIASHY